MQTRYNVKDYGAYGDNKADDTNAIKNAITAASAGGVVYFPRGTYKVTAELAITSKWISLQGDGRGLTSIYFSGPQGIRIENGWYNTISQMSILAAGPLDTLIRLKNCDAATVEDVYITAQTNAVTNGILIEGGGNYKNRIYTVDLDGNQKMTNGIAIGNDLGFSQGIYAHNVECAGMNGAGYFILNAGGVNLTDCEVLDSDAGLVLYPGAGMQIKGMQLENCLFDTCTKYGMALLDNGGSVNSFQAANCWASSTKSGPGVIIGCKGTGFLFTGCQAANNGQHGWRIDTGSTGALPTGISFSNCGAWGNSQQTVNTYSGFSVVNNATDFVITGGYSGNYSPFGFNNQKYGIEIGTGTDRYAVTNILANGNTTGACNKANSSVGNTIVQVLG